jgi:hypothetical protein
MGPVKKENQKPRRKWVNEGGKFEGLTINEEIQQRKKDENQATSDDASDWVSIAGDVFV